MPKPNEATTTDLLQAWNAGDRDAAAAVLSRVYDELRRIAAGYFRRERRDHTLQATAIVHEAYLRLVQDSGIEWQSRTHFVGTAAHLMRRILVDHARRRGTAKRGGAARRVTLVEAEALEMSRPPDLVEIDDALSDLTRIDERKASIVELRFFGGLTIDETAEHLQISPKTVVREWRRAKAWLFGRLKEDRPAPPEGSEP